MSVIEEGEGGEKSAIKKRPASTGYARTILRQAARQHVNRLTIVRKKEARAPNEGSQVPQMPTLRVGAVTGPDWRYVGPSERIAPSDPHDALFAVAIVESVLHWHEDLQRVYDHCYLKDREEGRLRRDHYELLRLVAAEIGEVYENQEDDALRTYRLEQIEERKTKMVRYVLKHRTKAA